MDQRNITSKIDVSIIIPIYNGEKWIDTCFASIQSQTAIGELGIELCICNDCSTDATTNLLQTWKCTFDNLGVKLKVFTNESGGPKGVGYSKNRAVQLSTGTYLCFQDVDDIMFPERVLTQFKAAICLPKNTLIGSHFIRTPETSTSRFTKWANELPDEALDVQIYTSNGPTVIMPTWFCHRETYNKETIWNLRLEHLQERVLNKWSQFTIWNAGKQGRKLYKSLKESNKSKVVAMCDVDVKKINTKYSAYDVKKRQVTGVIDIIHFREAKPPFVICVKLDMTNGAFEDNLKSLNLKEGKDYVQFN